jgi:uncharacterized protein (TIGR02266 family)
VGWVDEQDHCMTSADDTDERRESARRPVRVGVTLTSDSNLYVGFTDNISEGGLFVATHELLEIGEQVRLEFELPGSDETIEVDGDVRWHRRVSDVEDGIYPGYGVQFIDLADSDKQRLQKFLKQRDPMFHPD